MISLHVARNFSINPLFSAIDKDKLEHCSIDPQNKMVLEKE